MKNKLTVEKIFSLAVEAYQEKKFSLAEKYYKEIVKKFPDNVNTLINLGMTLKQLEKFNEAIDCYKRSIQINPKNANSYYNLANLYNNIEKYDEAITFYKKTIEINPNFLGAYNNLGNILKNLNKYESAISFFNQAIQIDPRNAVLYNNLGISYNDIGEIAQAHKCFSEAFKINPNLDYLLGSLIQSKHCIVEWKYFEKDLKDLSDRILKNDRVCSPFQSVLFFDSPNLQSITAQKHVKEKYYNKKNSITFLNKQSKKKIRIGYYSADFYNHAMSYLLVRLFELHDKSKFEIIAFSFGPDKNDELSKRISNTFNKFIKVNLKTDKEIAEISKKLNIDIAVDLMCYTTNSRIGIFSERCAPIQINYLGYPGTSSAEFIDYVIADKTLIPKKNQKYFSEKIVYLPNTYQVRDSTQKISNKTYKRKDFNLPEDNFVFCCFNQNYKITPDVYDIWMRLLKKVDGSVLWLLKNSDIGINNLKKEARKRGVDPNKIIFAERMAMPEHLARHKLADLFIDTFPYTAHTTCSDALWAGLPVITRIGESFASRVGASLLYAIGLEELITKTKTEYENLAIKLATESGILKNIKNKLEKNKIKKPLFNTQLYTSNIETAYKKLYKNYHSNLAIKNIEIK